VYLIIYSLLQFGVPLPILYHKLRPHRNFRPSGTSFLKYYQPPSPHNTLFSIIVLVDVVTITVMAMTSIMVDNGDDVHDVMMMMMSVVAGD
jgi:hypothetical protein